MNPLKRIFSMFKEPDKTDVQWNTISTESELVRVIEQSHSKPQIIYKHSTICSFSRMAQSELMASSEEIEQKADSNYLGVIESRPISNKVSSELQVRHESPQVIIIKNGEAVWDTSHGGVRGNAILDQL